MEERVVALVRAARAVIANWSEGDLAGAVNELERRADEFSDVPEDGAEEGAAQR